MVDLFYPDECVIKRATGDVDRDTYKELFSVVYRGRCGVQIGGGGDTYYRGMSYQREPIVVIPDADVKIKTNDVVVVNGEDEYTVLTSERCLQEEVKGTTIWLKDGQVR